MQNSSEPLLFLDGVYVEYNYGSAEDSRERLVARLNQIMRALNLPKSEVAQVIDKIAIWDVSGTTIAGVPLADQLHGIHE